MELKTNNMKKGPYKMKYTNGKKADTSAFPFKESPAKMMPGLGMMTGSGREMPTTDKGHTHTQDYIVKQAVEGQTSSNSLDAI